MIGISIQPHNDIHLDATGNLVMARDAEAVAQHLRQRLKFWRGEWFLDGSVGVDWLRFALGQAPSAIAIAEAQIKRAILATPGVREILEIDVIYDRASRGLIVRRCVVETTFDASIDVF